jgi:hypothetical protein
MFIALYSLNINEKSLRSVIDLRDELINSRYHPDYPLDQEITSGSNKPYPVTWATGSHY